MNRSPSRAGAFAKANVVDLLVAILRADDEPLTHAQYGPFRRLHLTPAQAREQHAGATWVPVVDALTGAGYKRSEAVAAANKSTVVVVAAGASS